MDPLFSKMWTRASYPEELQQSSLPEEKTVNSKALPHLGLYPSSFCWHAHHSSYSWLNQTWNENNQTLNDKNIYSSHVTFNFTDDRSRQCLGGEAAGWGKAEGRGGGVHVLFPASCTKVHLSWHGLCATWLGTYLYGTEEIKKPEGKKLPSFLQGEPLGSRKQVTLLPASLPIRAATSEARWSGQALPCWELKWWLALLWAGRKTRSYLQGLP